MDKFTRYCAAGAAVLTPFLPVVAQAATSTIYDFTKQTGVEPFGGLVEGANGVFYGTTSRGALGHGSVYSLTQGDGNTWKVQVLYRFLGGADGATPLGSLVLDPSGVLYGITAANSKAATLGTVYSLVPPAKGSRNWTKKTLYSFKGKADGGYPEAGLVRSGDGTLYGTTNAGGDQEAPSGWGVVFMLTPPSAKKSEWAETVLHTFTDGYDGGGPAAPLLLDSSGVLYGTTVFGGNVFGRCRDLGCGTVFQVMPPQLGETKWTEKVLYDFHHYAAGTAGGLVGDQAGNFYGTESVKCYPNVCGQIYKLSPPAHGGTFWNHSVLYTFPPGKGAGPVSPLILGTDFTLYGVTMYGGSSDEGIAYKLTPPAVKGSGWSKSLLYNFNPHKAPGDGAYPSSPLLLTSTNILLGVTRGGGMKRGVIFALTP